MVSIDAHREDEDEDEDEDELEEEDEDELFEYVFSVTEALETVKLLFQERVGTLAIRGQISGVSFPSSGHWYFKLKDAHGVLDSAMFRPAQRNVLFRPSDDMEVTCWGKFDIYPKSGRFQFIVEQIERHQGLGDLAVAFQKLKERLKSEGLFEASRKKPLPSHPKRIGLITSLTGAAIRDLLIVLGRRSPSTAVLLAPCKVQGDGAAQEIVAMLQALNRQPDIDLIIVGRGGGSIEDLWAFNEEIVARAIAASRIPILTGIGHETDTTIADLVADKRAPTPSAAAELAVPDHGALATQIHHLQRRLSNAFQNRMTEARLSFQTLLARLEAHDPKAELQRYQERLRSLQNLLHLYISDHLKNRRFRLFENLAKLESLSPLRVLDRGYSLVLAPSGKIVLQAQELSPDDVIRLRFSKGEATARIESITVEGEGLKKEAEPP